ncbi:YeeE/YedE family protein [Legionella oakridgensis]|uniref:Transporter protein n=2 Tax=Legionella oakridgensis TaxID=29423 RepID=A0A0W0WXW1_9GAMM|nr:YeeE/YedE family protein [Legionella oakridgensis]AHE67013.1 putative transporter component [Legionella oakridgensis ATCC 33761 = DSM 21215]KTD37167.1 transporter protein [Legionella oakridgensis]STY20112.1 transporter component [Legionella longbeachae]
MDYLTFFTPLRGFIGGILIGLSAVLFLWLNGRIAGMSGLIHGLCPPKKLFEFWRLTFLLGLITGGLSFYLLLAVQFTLRSHYPVYLLLLGGFCVGFGTRMGQGCTSGHGVCGIARFSKRSIVATFTFIISAMITVFILRHILGVY